MLPEEAAARIPENAPPSDWPKKGAIKFDKVSFRYRKGLPLVLRDIDMEIQPGKNEIKKKFKAELKKG